MTLSTAKGETLSSAQTVPADRVEQTLFYYHFSVLSFYSQKAGYFPDCSARDLLGRDGN